MVRVWTQTDLPLSPLGLSSEATSSKRPFLTTLSLSWSPNGISHSLSYFAIGLFVSLSPPLGCQLGGQGLCLFTDVSSVPRTVSGTQ